MRSVQFIIAVGFVILASTAWTPEGGDLHESVSSLLEALGDDPSPHYADLSMEHASMDRGKDIVLKGKSNRQGKKSRLQSKYFTCVACHNVEREDPDLADPSPKARLPFVAEKQLPYLQGSPLYGVVNRSSFYNGDYEKKYGDLVKPTRRDLRKAIQLCAVECSQGRALKAWEIESVLAYLWTIDLKVADLNLSEEEKNIVEKALNKGEDRQGAIELIKSKFKPDSPARFLEPPVDRTKVSAEADPVNGERLYELSCLHCHLNNPFAFFRLDRSKVTFRYLQKHLSDYTEHSVYQVVRYGTLPKGGKRGYMPQYTEQKMTDVQLSDLRAYIDRQVEKP